MKSMNKNVRFLTLLSALLLPYLCNAAETLPIERLFTTPDERTRLDQLRQSGGKEDDPAAQPAQSVVDKITLDGFVRRSNGKNTTWLNQIPQNEHEISQGITVLQRRARPPAISLQLESGKRLELKPGQTYDVNTGKVSDVYGTTPTDSNKIPVNKEGAQPAPNTPNAKH